VVGEGKLFAGTGNYTSFS